MKRFITMLVAITLMLTMAWGAWAGGVQFARCSGEKTSDAAIYAGPCAITAVHIITDSTNDAKLIVYDNASAASGTVRLERTQEASNIHGGSLFWCFPKEMDNGIYADITGTGASYIIEYIPR